MASNNKKVAISSKEFLDQNVQRMYDMMLKQMHTDFDIVINDRKIALHKIVMIAASEYFQNYDWDSERGRHRVELGNFKSEAAQWVISFCYTGNIELSEEYVGDVITLGSRLQIDKLIDLGFDYLSKHINWTSCFEIVKLANLHDRRELKETAFDYICQNFLKVVKTNNFLLIDYDLITEILKSDEINVNTEEDAFNALKSWINYNRAERSKHLLNLLGLIKMDQLSLNFLISDVQSFCSNDTACLSSIFNAIRQKTNPNSTPASDASSKPRSSTLRCLIVGGRNSEYASTIEIYDPFANNWNVHFDMDLGIPVNSFGAVIVKSELIIVGGWVQTAVNTVFSVNLHDKTSKSLPSMLTRRSEARCIELNGFLYVIGGFDGFRQVDSVERFDLVKNTWKYISSLSIKRVGFGICKYENKIYIAGGHSDDGMHDELEVYSPGQNKWSTLKSMNKKRNYIELIVCKGKFYAIGGSDSRLNYENIIYDDIECYDPATNVWTIISTFPGPRLAAGACAVHDKIIINGGRNKEGLISEVLIYNVNKNSIKKYIHTGRIHPAVLSVSVSDIS